ncbi:hypothetical protein A6V36_37000 [Paraburkholderia ginsengiterrae]|uniref:Uncharacterized protein n=1 Tax=Paraburkholderia ginsengiterrae TaxID=1462993 RepID=A0A1A9N0N7_9BURK|nr:hypothetical protein [Paraburkholderia ginsengiterrae]OAJ53585.1 hypothetical protein A6V36_37000 [Paraburkholderia ginsengiterrae]OAJ55314.1 hypothetical protein A6V37_33065 [Paraburkholderia ginsengiterrae]
MTPARVRTLPAGEPFDLLPAALLARLDNVDRWVALYPEARAVRGWRHEGFNGVTHRFVAHSVIRTAAGLVDVTLPSTEPARPFIEHPRAVCGLFAVLCRTGLDRPGDEFRVEFAAQAAAREANRDFTPDDPTDGDCL